MPENQNKEQKRKIRNEYSAKTVINRAYQGVSLTHLRGLEVNELDVDMLPGL